MPVEPKHTIRHRPGLVTLTALCAAITLFGVAAWIVNVEVAVEGVWGAKLVLLRRFELLERLLTPLAIDWSTVSTFVIVLLGLFPAVAGYRVLTAADPTATAAVRAGTPYPAGLAIGMVWAGIFGTLIGLWIALRDSGIDVTAGVAAADGATVDRGSGLSEALSKLFAGTATAIWSSLLGIAGAYLVVQPVPALFRRLGPDVGAERDPLQATIEKLDKSLTELRKTTESVNASAKTLFEQLDRMTEDSGDVKWNEVLLAMRDSLAEQQKTQNGIRTDVNAKLDVLATLLRSQQKQRSDFAKALSTSLNAVSTPEQRS
jgi:hypothetical protein